MKRFRRTQWRFQQTFSTPLAVLDSFASTILQASGPAESATVIVDAVVFPPDKLLALLSRHGLPPDLPRDMTITAEAGAEAADLLVTSFGGWVDFLFVPAPKPFVIYADHDGYTTFFAARQSSLQAVTDTLTAGGFAAVKNHTRRFR